MAGWGTSWWYTEVDAGGEILRVLQSYAAGQVLRYDDSWPQDEFGGMPEGIVAHDEIQELVSCPKVNLY